MYKLLLRPLLFLLPPESAHYFTFSLLKLTLSIPGFKALFKHLLKFNHPVLTKEVFGLEFPNPVGLAAGFDKDARMIDEMEALGFGFVEIGTLTPVGQPGNDKPRLFRLPKDHSLINRMGFNNQGVEAAITRLKNRKSGIIVGGNIGKNKVTPNEEAVNDYLSSYQSLYNHVDYFVVNVSSPNTPNLRALQDKEPLMHLLKSLQEENDKKTYPKPILLKIAPDLTDSQLNDIVDITRELQLDGLIATNTTISRENLSTTEKQIKSIGAGGLSGAALTKRSTEVIRYLNHRLEGRTPIIGVGGIFSPQDALEKIEAGATLIQLYTGFVYEGPSLVKRINQSLAKYGGV